MPTCGDIDGKPCEWFRKLNCPMAAQHEQNNLATCTDRFIRDQAVCPPVFALLAARKDIGLLTANVSRLTADIVSLWAMVHAQKEQIGAAAAARDDALAESAKWERAAEALSATCGAMQVGCPGGDYCGKQASPELCAPCYLKQALAGTVHREPIKEVP